MPTTTNKSLPYPSASDPVNISGDIQALAEAVDTYVTPGDNDQIVLGPALFS